MLTVLGRNSERIGRDNLSAVLREVHRHGAVSRSELAERTGLYRQTIRSLVGQLAERGLVDEDGAPTAGTRGRPSLVVRPRTDTVRVLALDVEVDSLAAAIVSLGGTVLRSVRVARPRDVADPAATIEALAGAADAVLRAGPRDERRVLGIGVAVVGLVRRDDGFVRLAPNLGWTDVPLADLVAARMDLGVPVVVGNEADLGGMAEHLRGAAEGARNVLYVSGEVGIGGGLIVDGRPLDGHRGYAGEIGHLAVNPDGRRCGCGATGCWETEVGEAALVRRAGITDADARSVAGAGESGVARVLEAADAGDDTARRAIADVGRWTGIGLASLVNVLNPEVVVLGGLLARLHPRIEVAVDRELRNRATTALREGLTVRPALFGADAPLLGAAELALEHCLADPASLPTIPRVAATPAPAVRSA
jgi:predicted NBD/HSP70 family sugar kinase